MKPDLRLFNTLTRATEEFQPLNPPKVGIYSCGPTVYSRPHIGNMRAFVFADTLRRTLEYFGYEVRHVMNITDVGHLTDDADAGDDKMEVGAKREGLTAWDVAAKYTEAFFEDTAALNILRPHVVCKATDHIQDQIDMVTKLEEKGFTYATDDGVYFDTAKFPRYTEFARLDVEGLQEGHRVDATGKRNKTDFALWKFSKPEDKRQMEWDSPWGRGFPGWHIECSAMSTHYLGERFDIHTGGIDHVPVHHTNEIAQTECALDVHPWVKYWMHNEFLLIDEAPKMSKSLGNVVNIPDLAARGLDPRVFRLLCMQSHYRKQMTYGDENLRGAARFFERLQASVSGLGEAKAASGKLGEAAEAYRTRLKEALGNDLNTAQAVANLSELLEDKTLGAEEKKALVEEHDRLLGLDLFRKACGRDEAPEELMELLAQRNAARAAKDWAAADRLRDEILAAGYEILDAPEGSSLKRRL